MATAPYNVPPEQALSPVATSGSYNDLSNKPDFTALSQPIPINQYGVARPDITITTIEQGLRWLFEHGISAGGGQAKPLYHLWIGNSKVKGDFADLVAYTTNKAQQYLTSIGDSRIITTLNLGVNGFSNSQLNQYFVSGYHVGQPDGQSVPVDTAIRKAITDGYDVRVFIGENFNEFWTVEKYNQNVSATDVFNQLQLLVSKIKAIDGTIKIITNTPAAIDATYWNANNTIGAQYNVRPDYTTLQEQISLLIVNDSKNGSRRYTVADNARDTRNSNKVPTFSGDGVHENLNSIQNSGAGKRWVDAYLEAEFGIAQPAPYLAASTVYVPPVTYLADYTTISFSELEGIVGSEGRYSAITDGQFFGHKGTPAYKLPALSQGRIVFEYLNGNSGSTFGFCTSPIFNGFADFKAAVWITDSTPEDPIPKLNVMEENGDLNRTINHTLVSEYFYGILRSTDGSMRLQYSMDAGASWITLTTFAYNSTAELFIAIDLNSGANVAYVQGQGIVAMSGAASAYMPGYSALSYPTTNVSHPTSNTNGVWTATADGSSFDHTGLSNLKMPANANAAIGFKFSLTSGAFIFGLSTNNALTKFDAMRAGIWVTGNSKALNFFDNGDGNAAGVSAEEGYWVLLRRVGPTITIEVSPNGTVWTVATKTFSVAANIDLYPVFDLAPAATLSYPQQAGLIS